MPYVSGRVYTGKLIGVSVEEPVPLHPTQACREVMVQNDPSNTGNLLVGTKDDQYVVLTPGQALTLPVISLSLIYVKMASINGDVNWLARD